MNIVVYTYYTFIFFPIINFYNDWHKTFYVNAQI